MPGPLIDNYVFISERNSKSIFEFLEHFVPEREPSWHPDDPYELLNISDRGTVEELIEFICRCEDLEYSFYWRNRKSCEPYNAMVVFCEDGGLVLGLSATTDSHWELARDYLHKMKVFCGVDSGFCSLEYPPPSSKDEFDDALKTWSEHSI